MRPACWEAPCSAVAASHASDLEWQSRVCPKYTLFSSLSGPVLAPGHLVIHLSRRCSPLFAPARSLTLQPARGPASFRGPSGRFPAVAHTASRLERGRPSAAHLPRPLPPGHRSRHPRATGGAVGGPEAHVLTAKKEPTDVRQEKHDLRPPIQRYLPACMEGATSASAGATVVGNCIVALRPSRRGLRAMFSRVIGCTSCMIWGAGCQDASANQMPRHKACSHFSRDANSSEQTVDPAKK